MNRQQSIRSLFDATLERHGAMISRITSFYATSRLSADDLFQEVMVSLWLGLETFRGRSSMSTWVYRVTINTCISMLRRHDVKGIGHLDENTIKRYEREESVMTDPVEANDNLRCLNLLIGRLGPLDKAIILMWLDERPYTEISDVTGLSVRAVGTRINRIKSKLQKMWQNENR